jgi:N-acetylglucosamine kinase-like BadF-type ATPase
VGAQAATDNCRRAAEAAIADARRVEPSFTRNSLSAWGFGLAGVRREQDAFLMRGHLNALVGGLPWVLDTDAAAAQTGAFSGAPGVVLSAGTGAICLGISAQEERFYADGRGPILGDEGSGYWIGLEALREVCRVADGRSAKGSLSSAVLTALNLSDVGALVQWIHAPDTSHDQIARLAQLVFDLAGAGGQAAIDIRERAVERLAASVNAVVHAMLVREQQLAIGAPEPLDILIALRGGLFEDDFFKATVGYAIGERMTYLKRDFAPINSWRIVRPQFDAAVGASLLAQKAIN